MSALQSFIAELKELDAKKNWEPHEMVYYCNHLHRILSALEIMQQSLASIEIGDTSYSKQKAFKALSEVEALFKKGE